MTKQETIYKPGTGIFGNGPVYGSKWVDLKKDARWFGMNKGKNNRVNKRKY